MDKSISKWFVEDDRLLGCHAVRSSTRLAKLQSVRTASIIR